MVPLMYLKCNRFRRTTIHLYTFLDALLRVITGSRAPETPRQKHSLLLKKEYGRERSSLLQNIHSQKSRAQLAPTERGFLI